MFEGITQKDSKKYKKGEYYKFMNLIYGEGDGKWKEILRNWGRQNECIVDGNCTKTNEYMGEGGFYFKAKTHYKTFPPVDSLYVDVNKDLVSSSSYFYRKNPTDWKAAYKLYQKGGNHSSQNAKPEKK